MFVKIHSIGFKGIETIDVAVEVNVISRGLPAFEIVGLAGKAVEESRYRVKNAIINSGFEFPNKKITVNLAPADLSKEGTYYDLPIALGILCADLNIKLTESSIFIGELSMGGEILPLKRAYLFADHAKNHKFNRLCVPMESAKDAFLGYANSEIFITNNLKEVYQVVFEKKHISKYSPTKDIIDDNLKVDIDFADIVGNQIAKRALEIAAVGSHNVLLTGPPGSGKTMLSKAFRHIIPPMTDIEQADVLKIYSYSGKPYKMGERPYRNPHHTTSLAGMIGGGIGPNPGELSLSHNGVLFMDEFCEFPRNIIEVLREPLEEKYLILTRSTGRFVFPTKFILIAATNPCPCGYFGSSEKVCICSLSKINEYKSKVSGPIADRIDIFADVVVKNRPTFISDLIVSDSKNENTFSIKNRVSQAVEYKSKNYIQIHEEKQLFDFLTADAKKVLDRAFEKLFLSPRALIKTIKVAQSIACLNFENQITQSHISEALHYRYKQV